MPIVDPGPIWKVDFARAATKTEFSHGLGRLPAAMKGGYLASQFGCQLSGGEIALSTSA